MKPFTRTLVILSLTASILLSSGCTRAKPQEPDSTTAVAETLQSQIPATTEAPSPENSTLFNRIFVPTVQGEISTEKAAFQEAVTACGFTCYEEAGVIMVHDSVNLDYFIRGEMLDGQEIDALVYSCLLGDVQRQTRAAGINTGNPVYYIGVTNYKRGQQVQSLEDVRGYLNADITAEETAQPDSETEFALFEDIFLPLAEGKLENSGQAIHAAVNEKGYYYVTGEGTFVIHDDRHPENYLYGDPMLLDDIDTVGTLGFHLASDTGAREVAIDFFTMPRAYRICDPSTGNSTLADSLEELKDHIYQSR